MRAGTIGRWVKRAVVLAAVAVGFLAVGSTAASADPGQAPDTVSTQGIEWN